MMGPEIDVGALSQLSSENLRVVLRKIPGSKDLIIEPKLMKPLDRFELSEYFIRWHEINYLTLNLI